LQLRHLSNRNCYFRSIPELKTTNHKEDKKDMIPMHSPDEHRSEIIEQEPIPETQANNADFLLETGIEVESSEKQKYITDLGKLLIGFHNTTANPKRLELSHFTKVDVFKLKFNAPPMDPNIALPSDYSLLTFYLKRNGKAEVFNVEQTFARPATGCASICLMFD